MKSDHKINDRREENRRDDAQWNQIAQQFGDEVGRDVIIAAGIFVDEQNAFLEEQFDRREIRHHLIRHDEEDRAHAISHAGIGRIVDLQVDQPD